MRVKKNLPCSMAVIAGRLLSAWLFAFFYGLLQGFP
jgi:hypothetical protein